MQVWVVALSPATELTDLEAVAVLCRLAAGATALADEPLDQQGIAPDGSTACAASNSRETYASASALSMPSKNGGRGLRTVICECKTVLEPPPS